MEAQRGPTPSLIKNWLQKWKGWPTQGPTPGGQSPPSPNSPAPTGLRWGMGREALGVARWLSPTHLPTLRIVLASGQETWEAAAEAGSRPGASSLPRGRVGRLARGGTLPQTILLHSLPPSLPPSHVPSLPSWRGPLPPPFPLPARPGGLASGFISQGPVSLSLPPIVEFLTPSPLSGPCSNVTSSVRLPRTALVADTSP